jgi:putative sigma-54 modulation protein
VQVSVTCRHGSITDEVRDYITRKSEKLLTFFERVFAISVTVDVGKDRVSVELLVDTEHRHNFVARDEGDEVPGTFDRVLHKMEQQIKKYKEKIQDHRRDKSLNDVAEQSLGAASETEPNPEAE